MTKYLDRSFSVPLGSDNFRNNFDATFGKKDAQPEQPAALAPVVIDRQAILKEIDAERAAQDAEHGGPDHDDTHEPHEWAGFITEHLLRGKDPEAYRKQMVRVAALAVAAIEVHDRKVARG